MLSAINQVETFLNARDTFVNAVEPVGKTCILRGKNPDLTFNEPQPSLDLMQIFCVPILRCTDRTQVFENKILCCW